MSPQKESPGPRIYILDSCAYFRLARSIRPLLGQVFGTPPHYKFFVIRRMVDEHLGNPRLKNKFHWISEPEIQKEISSGTYTPKAKKRESVEEAMSFLNSYVEETYIAEQRPGPSPADLEALAVAYAIPGIVVSDDKNLCETGEAFEIKTISTIDLLEKLILDKIITQNDLQTIADYWDYDNDLPMGRREFRDRIKALRKAHRTE